MAKNVDYLLIGGGLASAFCAETLRKEQADGSILILSEESMLPYYRPQLPKSFLLGKRRKEQMLIFPQHFYEKHNIDVQLNTKVLALTPAKRTVKTNRSGLIHYGQLLIATGSIPEKLKIPGIKLNNIFYIHTVDDAEPIIPVLKKAKSIVIYGGSFIGVEIASTLSQMDIDITIITEEFHIFNVSPSEEIAAFIADKGVTVLLHESIKKFNGTTKVKSVLTDSGKTIPCDLVIITDKYLTNTDFLKNSGIKLDDGVVVDQYLQTNKPNIYAAGDVAKFYDPLFRKCHRNGGIDNAMKQGRIAALNMMGLRKNYYTASYFYFHAFDNSFVIIGDISEATERIVRGSIKKKNFSFLYLKEGLLQGAFFSGRPIEEIKAAESLILNRLNLQPFKKKLFDINFLLSDIAVQKILTLQGGGALGAFECGAVKAMEELGIYPDIVAGISIGAFNSAIIASNPKHATEALESFWDDLAFDMMNLPDEQTRRLLSSWHTMLWGSPNFFYPRWSIPMDDYNSLPTNWTSFYDTSAMKDLLHKYIDFSKLKDSPIRLLVMAVNVETSEFVTFDSYTDIITADHILASGSLPPGFPWTTINKKHYWDGGIITNTPLDSCLDICGSTSKKVYVVELYSRTRPLPKNMIEVLARKDEILFAEKIRKNINTRDLISSYKKLIDRIMSFCATPELEEIRQLPAYIQLMGDPGVQSITRITRNVEKGEPYAWDSDFSRETIEQLKKLGYKSAKKILKNEQKITAKYTAP